MRLEGEQTLLRVYVRSTDKQGWFSRPAAEVLVERARGAGLAGATVLEGILGLDVAGNVLEPSAWSLSRCVPVIVEVVDAPGAIGRFLDEVREVVPEGLATLERGHVLLYRHTRDAAERAARRLEVPAPVTPLSTLPSPEQFPAMRLAEEGRLLRVFVGESDVWQGQPLYRAVVLKARELGVACAAALRGPMGFGANSRVHTAGLLRLSADLPVVVEVVAGAGRAETLLPFLEEAVTEGLVTVEDVRVLTYRRSAPVPASPS